MQVTDELLAEIKAKAEKATCGPWRHDGYNLYGDPDSDGWTPVAVAECHRSPIWKGRYKLWEANAAHIARMDPPTTLALVAEIERLQEWKNQALILHERLSDTEVLLGKTYLETQAEIERLREALKPFALRNFDKDDPDHYSTSTLIGYCRRARTALEGK